MPEDTTPHGGEALHELPDRARIPEGDRKHATHPLPPVSGRPAIPTEAEVRAADIEDEEADPVVDSGPGIDDATGGKTSVTRQPG